MIIDDSPVDRRMIRQILERSLDHVVVFEADDGFGIPNIFSGKEIHMCILDIMMPGKNGFEVLEEMKANRELMDIPIIVCTGMEDRSAIEKALRLGAYDYFSKPLTEEVMKISLPLKVKNAIDFTKRKQEIEFLSYHDKLTGLYNRRFCEEELKRLDSLEQFPIAILFGDVNGLKLTNDAYGHEVGDQLLLTIGKILSGFCGNGEMASRIGGDEFLMILPHTSIQEAEVVANQIRRQCEEQEAMPVKPSVSIGIAVKGDSELSLTEVMKVAEDRMYSLKLAESKKIRNQIIESVQRNLKVKYPDIDEHCKRLSQMAIKISESMGFSQANQEQLTQLALLHDIGITGVPESITQKKGHILENEWDIVKNHCEIGYRIANASSDLSNIAPFILSHHEHWDGSGYPQGLVGEEIPLQARVLAVLDTYDAMLHGTFYQKPYPRREVVDYIKSQREQRFDPNVVDHFMKTLDLF